MELFEAVSRNDVIQVMRLLEDGVDPNEFGIDQHYNALHYAVYRNAIDVVLLLVTAGADLEAVTEENLNVFDIAKSQENYEMTQLLIKLSHMRISRSKKYNWNNLLN